MSRLTLKPFHSQEEAARHMVDLLAAEGNILDAPLSEEERESLVCSGGVSDELASKAKYLITHILDSEKNQVSDPRSFSNSMRWAADPAWPNIAELVAQVASERNPRARLSGWRPVKDRIALFSCGLLLVLLMFAAVIVAGFIFHWK
jgi:hypothetical protein